MAARDKKPKGSGAPPPDAAEPEPQPQQRPKSRLAAPPAPAAKTKTNFKLNMIPVGGAGLRRRGRPAKRPVEGGRRGRGRPSTLPDAKPSLARLVKRKQLISAAGAKKMILNKKPAKKSTEPEVEESVVVKKEIDPEPVVPESRSASPKTRKSRTSRASSDLAATTSQNDSGAKSPYSTRSERSNSPFSQTPTQKSLRNGKQRSLKNALLSEAVESEKRKRSRLASESVDAKNESNSIEDDKKIKRLRSHSRDGSEISKCSDVTESDMSYCDNLIADSEAKTEIKKETKDLPPDPCPEDVQMKDVKVASESSVKTLSPTVDPAPLEKLSDSSLLDCENNNKNSESNESVASIAESLENTSQNPEKIVEKSLILDNMSKTFNEVSASESSKGIRRSARQRKITVKAKEHEEAILAENSLDVDTKPVLKLSKGEDEEGVPKSAEDPEANDGDALSNHVSEGDNISPKVVNDLNKVEKNLLNSEPSTIKVEPLLEKSATRLSVEDKNEGEEITKNDSTPKLPQNSEIKCTDKPDESSKENIQSTFSAKSMQVQDFGKLIDRLKNFEEQDERKRQEKMLKFNNTEKRAVMVTNDVVLIPKSTMDSKALKDKPNTLTIEKIKDKEKINCFDSTISIVKKDEIHTSYDLPKSVTLIKRTSSSSSRKHSTGSSSRDEDSVTMIDKSLGKEVTFDIRKSIDKGILSIEASKSPQTTTLSCSSSLQVVPSSSRIQKSISLKETPAVIHIVPINSENSETSTENPVSNPSPVDIVSKEDSIVTFNAIAAVPVPKSVKVNQPNDKVPVTQFMESPEKQKQKEEILGKLGLLTHKAANEAKLEKQKQKLLFKTNETYTGTLKTIIKLNRNSPDKKKNRSLKMTFHKNKNRGNKLPSDTYSGDSDSDDGPSYTINKKEFGVSSGVGSGSSDSHLTSGGHRKTHYSNRYNNHELGLQESLGDSLIDTSANKEATTSLVIPEKASSFAIHPDRICQDQCFYCGGKFGLFDTPCHIAQIKSADRQKKILDNEEKLTVDSCLCDACYRHVDRRANCASYRKRVGPGPSTTAPTIIGVGDVCYVSSCNRPAPQTLRRKWLVKMRKSVNKVVQLDLDYPGLHTIPLCDDHYQAVLELMVCGLCKRELSKNHVRYINQEYRALNPLLKDQGLPVVFEDKPVVCKLCRYYCTLLLRPSKSLMNKQTFLKTHRKRLLQAHNLRISEESDTDFTDEPSLPDANHDQIDSVREKKKSKNGKSKSKKDENNILNQTLHKNKGNENWKSINHDKSNLSVTSNSKDCIEDIESLISTNKIPNLIASKTSELDAAGIPVIEISEKCSVPMSGILLRNTATSLTQKSKNILKVHNAPAINKLSHSQKKLHKNLRRIQKLGQIITQKGEFEEALNSKLPNREEFTIEPMNDSIDSIGHSILRNIVLNDECTIETIPPKSAKSSVDINSMKSKWQNTESFSQVKKNLSTLSKNFVSDQNKKRVFNPSDSQFSNPVRRLETNPSISVRELFPGEEEMNLQCSIEFGNVKTTTPEGWEKCSSIIQYDNSTKQLWQHLQQPYGNQSSFLRHLILLEKYFRNGDLVLSPNANCNAITYSESVQNRLRAFDNVLINGSLPVVTTIQKPQQMSTTITQIETTDSGKKLDSVVEFRKPIVNIGGGKSLLKSNQITNVESNKKVNKSDSSLLVSNQIKIPKNSVLSQVNDTINGSKQLKGMAASLTHLEKLGNQLTPIQIPIPRPPTPRPELSKTVNELKLISSPFSTADLKTSTPKSDSSVHKIKSSLPPELIAINPQTILPRKSIEKVLKNIQQLSKNSSSPIQTQVTITANTTTSTVTNAQQQKASKTTVTNAKDSKKGKTATKQWRPTLIPITDETKSRSNRDVLHQTADGRKLPSLVKVTQGGKPYHITIEDYNRMCIMRREKLQQMQQTQKPDQNKSSSVKTTDVSSDSSTASSAVNKSQSPVSIESENGSVTGKSVESSALSVPNIPNLGKTDDSNDKGVTVLSEVENSSLLMNVALKNITIAPISTTSSAKTCINSSNPQSLLITSAKSVVQVPQVVAQLSPSVSVTAETVISSDINTTTALIPKVVPITSQAMIMPKIPKSLTVIPQSVTNTPNKVTSPVLAPSQNTPPLSVLPIPVTTTVAVSPPEP